MSPLPLLLALTAAATLTRGDLDRAAALFARAHPGARLLPGASGGLEHASRLAVPRSAPGDEENARAFLEREGRAFGVTGSDALRTVRVWGLPGHAGSATFARTFEGRPVFGGQVTVGWRADGVITLVNGARVLSAAPSGAFLAGAEAARAAALAVWPGLALDARVEEGWLQWEGTLLAVYRVEHEALDPLETVVTYVDAASGTVLHRVSRTRTAALPGCGPCLAPPCVCAYRDSPLVPAPVAPALARAPEAFPARELDAPGDRLKGRRTAAYDCLGKEANPSQCTAQRAVAVEGSFLQDPDPTLRRTDDPFAEQSAYYHIDDHSRFLDALDGECLATARAEGEAPRCFAERTAAGGIGFIPGYVNAFSKGAPYENAYFTPSGGPSGSAGVMIYGQGALVDTAYDAEIVYHELTHAAVNVTAAFEEFTDRFGANSDPGALDEGTADTFAFAHVADALAEVGPIDAASCFSRYFGAASSEACLRQADNARTCRGNGPNDGRNPGRDGEIHDDGEIWSGFTWALLRGAHAQGLRQPVARAMFAALESVGAHPTFLGYAETIRQKMADAGLPQAALDFADCTIAQRDLAGCDDRALALYSGERVQGAFYGVTQATGTTTAAQQYFVDVPCGAAALRLQAGDATGLGVTYLRYGRPVEFAAPGLGGPQFDWIVPANRDEVRLDAEGCAGCGCRGTRTPLGAGRWYFLPTGRAKDAIGNPNIFQLGVAVDVPDGQAAPQRVPWSIGAPGSGTDANVCTWGVTGPSPSRPLPAVPTAPPPLACAAPAAPTVLPSCEGETTTETVVGRPACGSGPGGLEGGLLALLGLAAVRAKRARTRRGSRQGA